MSAEFLAEPTLCTNTRSRSYKLALRSALLGVLAMSLVQTSFGQVSALCGAGDTLAGPAAPYNVFVTGSFTSSDTATTGDIAAGVNLSLSSYGAAQ